MVKQLKKYSTLTPKVQLGDLLSEFFFYVLKLGDQKISK